MITVTPIDRILSALDALTDETPELEAAVDFYEECLPLMIEARPSLEGLALHQSTAEAKLKEGVPLLWGEFGGQEALGIDPNIELFMTLCRLATHSGNDSGEVLMRAYLEGDLDLRSLLRQALVLDRPALTEQARGLQVDLSLLEAICRMMLTPITWAYAQAFSQAFDFAQWNQGYCPVCGAWPILGELRGRDKLRHLRCGRCGSGWKFNRLQCVWCDNTKQQELGFLYISKQPTWRVDVCDYCQGYHKTLITFDPLEADLLLVYDLQTMAMDHMATAAGYKRPFKQPLR